jgi:hypothetical protein
VSIENAPMTNFIDADLMGAATYTTGQVIRSTFIKQSENVIGNKGFIFTTCLRRSGLEESINGWLRNTILPIIGCDVKKIDLTNKERLTIHKESRISSNHQNNVNHVFKFNNIEINNPGRLEHISLYNYADDGGPMLTGLIVYI